MDLCHHKTNWPLVFQHSKKHTAICDELLGADYDLSRRLMVTEQKWQKIHKSRDISRCETRDYGMQSG